MVTRARAQAAPRVALAADDERTAVEVARVAGERGVPVERLALESAVAAPVGAIAYAPEAAPDAARAATLARLAAAAAENRRPIVMLCAFGRPRPGRAAEERAIVFAHLRAHGAVLCDDPDAWFETAVLLAAYGAPAGPRVALVAPPGGWLAAQAAALAAEETGGRLLYPPDGPGESDELPADLVLVDARLDAPAASRAGRALVVPLAARAELMPGGERTALVGLRAALAAAAAAARHAARLAQGVGPAPAAEAKRLKVDRARADKAMAVGGERLGDQESKLLLSAYGVPVTRQAVAHTPSAAVRYAEQIGWPVEMLPWDPERDGAAVTGVRNPPDVRRGFGAAASAAGLAVGVPIIVRQTPPAGRSLAARVERHASLGPMLLLDVPGAGPVAAPAPLRRADADELAAALEASRAGDAPPDRAALAELLQRASFAAVHDESIEALVLTRIVVGAKGEGAMAVDARVRLKRKR